jgi:colicin import membrane protein
MDRLQKKCFIVTASLHGLLVGVVLFGAALMPAHDEENNVKLFTMYDASKITDDPSSGGDPNVKAPVVPPAQNNPQPKPTEPTPPPPKPEPPVAKPEPKPEPKVEPKPEPKPERIDPPKVHNDIPKLTEDKPKNSRLKPEDLVPVTPKTHHAVKIDKTNLTEVTRKSDDKAKAQKEAADAADAADKAKRRLAAKTFASALRSLGKNLSTSTLVEMHPGPGGGGEVSANYRDIIASKYYNAWVAPVGLDDDTPVVVATVTISRSGDVMSARIIKRSGNSLMDRSIQNVLENVTFIEPFPESSHEQERTVTIQFNLQAKRQIG